MKELYRVECRDAEGRLVIVIVRRKRALFWWLRRGAARERGIILYTLPDGRQVRPVDERSFEIVDTGEVLRREDL